MGVYQCESDNHQVPCYTQEASEKQKDEKQIIVFKNSEPLWVSLNVEKIFIFNLDVLLSVLYRWRILEATVKIENQKQEA